MCCEIGFIIVVGGACGGGLARRVVVMEFAGVEVEGREADDKGWY